MKYKLGESRGYNTLNKRHILLVALMAVIAVLFIAHARPAAADFTGKPNLILINSANWEDVYSGMMYSRLEGIPASFLVSTRDSTIILFSYNPTDTKNILALSSTKNPYVVGYKNIIESRGFNTNEDKLDNFNFQLAQQLKDVHNFIIISSAYGYDAISVAPYASITHAYVLFADRTNIAKIDNYLQQQGVKNLTIYGNVDRQVTKALQKYNPTIIDKGDRYDNNLAIVQKYLNIKPTKQVILNNGEFIENQLISGDDPVVFIGTLNVPSQVQTFIENHNIQVGILIGNELIGTATTIRRQLGINVFVKFAQSARVPGGTISQVEDLQRFPLPTYTLRLEITGVTYNELSKTLEVTYHNPIPQSVYVKSTITVRGNNGTVETVRGDDSPLYIEGGTYRTVPYYDVNNLDPNSTAEVYALFGESQDSLELSLRQTLNIQTVSIKDDSQISLESFYYDKTGKAFYVVVKNNGKVDTYVQLQAPNVIIKGLPVTLGSDTLLLKAGHREKIRIPSGQFSTDDVADNPTVKILAYYGERRESMINTQEKDFPLVIRQTPYLLYGIIVAVLLMLLLVFFVGKKCKSCGERNMITAKHCKRCGREI